MIPHAIKQVDDPVGIQIQIRHLLPEPVGAHLVCASELGLRQLTGEQEDQLTLLQLGKARDGTPAAPDPEASRASGGRSRCPGV